MVRPTSRPGPIGPRRRPVPPAVADERRRAAHTRRRHGLDPDLKDLAQAKNFAALTTLMPDGHPQTQIMWVGADDDEHVIINTQLDRQKYRNVLADPRVTVTVFDADNPYRYVEARGRVARPGRRGGRSQHRRAVAEVHRRGLRHGADGQSRHPVRRRERVHKNGY
ncbi:MAG: TIGR03618 family F420-dependent PPOX class oxidoreductase [Microthrixaceae bacterium]|nr:TIGR03618 family F420-dependent PPOX class oxidoreductase [Microthrixaceae bacterium]